MNVTTFYMVPQVGPVVMLAEMPFAPAGAPYVWDALGRRFLGGKPLPFWEERDWRRLSEYLTTDQMTFDEKAVLCSTLDYAVVEADRWPELANAYDTFADRHADPARLCNLPLFADVLREHYPAEPNVLGVGLRHTCEAPNPWAVYDVNLDGYRPYDAGTDDKHWLLYETLTELIANSSQDAEEHLAFLEAFYNQRFQIHLHQFQRSHS